MKYDIISANLPKCYVLLTRTDGDMEITLHRTEKGAVQKCCKFLTNVLKIQPMWDSDLDREIRSKLKASHNMTRAQVEEIIETVQQEFDYMYCVSICQKQVSQ